MLTDNFADRYLSVELWKSFGEPERRLLVQGYRILIEQICPYYTYDGKESVPGKVFWTDIHKRLSMELGLNSLSDLSYHFQTTIHGKPYTNSGVWGFDYVCKQWMLKDFNESESADQFIKERLSLVEIGFRKREEEIADANAALPEKILKAKIDAKRIPSPGVMRIPGNYVEALKNINAKLNGEFRGCVEELNTRFRQAGCGLNYHNGFIQRATDELTLEQVETPFWALVSDPKWENVDTDMKEALDLRDSEGRDPAFYAARALESTIKIVSDEKKWTTGKENGAHRFIENLASKRAGHFIDNWESEALKRFFTDIRNPFGHGPGSEKMPSLSPQQTDWAIETCMVWIKSIILRT
jgi:hypothetical protein